MARWSPLLLACALLGCAEAPNTSAEPTPESVQPLSAMLQQQQEHQGAAHPAAARTAPPPPPIVGTVAESIDVGNYTYLRLLTGAKDQWVAVPAAPVTLGAVVTVDQPMLMRNFESRSLHRTFETIAFGLLSAPASPSDEDAGGGPRVNLGAKVPRAEGTLGLHVAEIYSLGDRVEDMPISVRAQVVKVTKQVMGVTWLHLRDGSGSARTQDFDLPVTSEQTAKVGDLVLATGIVRLNHTVAPGYTYRVLLEDAILEKSP